MARKYVELHMHAWLIFIFRHIVCYPIEKYGEYIDIFDGLF